MAGAAPITIVCGVYMLACVCELVRTCRGQRKLLLPTSFPRVGVLARVSDPQVACVPAPFVGQGGVSQGYTSSLTPESSPQPMDSI